MRRRVIAAIFAFVLGAASVPVQAASSRPVIETEVSKSAITFECKSFTSPISVTVTSSLSEGPVWSSTGSKKSYTAVIDLTELRSKYPDAKYFCEVWDSAGNYREVTVCDPVKAKVVTKACDTRYAFWLDSCDSVTKSGKVKGSTLYNSEGGNLVLTDRNGIKTVKVGSKTVKCDGSISATVKVSKSCKVKVTDQRGDSVSMNVVVDEEDPSISVVQDGDPLVVEVEDNVKLRRVSILDDEYSPLYEKDLDSEYATVTIGAEGYENGKLILVVEDFSGNQSVAEIEKQLPSGAVIA